MANAVDILDDDEDILTEEDWADWREQLALDSMAYWDYRSEELHTDPIYGTLV